MRFILNKISVPARISIGLASLAVTTLLVAHMLGLIPDKQRSIIDSRVKISETISIYGSQAIAQKDFQSIETTICAIVHRHPQVLSIALRNADGDIVVQGGEHQLHWIDIPDDQSTNTHMHGPVFDGINPWGTLEIAFQPLAHKRLLFFTVDPIIELALFVGSCTFLIFWIFMRKMLRQFDPSSVIPERVKAMLDSLAEGLLVLDKEHRVVVANKAFVKNAGLSESELQGRKISKLQWLDPKTGKSTENFPWDKAISESSIETNWPQTLINADGKKRTFTVNATPILSPDGATRGAVTTLNDVTSIEKKNAQLNEMIKELELSQEEVRKKNEELEILATHDPLTNCLNRRSFFERAEKTVVTAQRYDQPLGFIILDIDHFKNINDTHGHSMGDQVLRQVAEILRTATRDSDTLCRYGGEEFCVLLPQSDLNATSQAAERYRQEIEATNIANIPVRISLGVSVNMLGADNLQQLIDQADQALYFAKENGRNQYACWDPSMAEDAESKAQPEEQVKISDRQYLAAFDECDDPRLIVSCSGSILDCNDAAAQCLGYGKSELIGSPLRQYMKTQDNDEIQQAIKNAFEEAPPQPFNIHLEQSDCNESYIFDCGEEPMRVNNSITAIAIKMIPIGISAQLQDLPHGVDSLTGLHDRSALEIQLAAMLEIYKNEPRKRFALLLIDLFGLNVVNDGMGRSAGDRLILQVAERVKTCVTLSQQSTKGRKIRYHVIRYGGTKFAVLQEPIESINDTVTIAKNLQKDTEQSYNINGHEIHLTTKIGIVTSDLEFQNPSDIIRDVEIAMSHAKRSGKATYAIFDNAMHQQAVDRLELEREMRSALRNDEFEVHYQPLICLDTGNIAGFEALSRWTHPTKGFISPAQFIPIAEETGMIMQLGEKVLYQACKQLKTWQKQFPQTNPLVMAINLSRRQLYQPGLVDLVRNVLIETGINPQTLELEITESLVMDHIDQILPVLNKLREIGVKLSMDDFGTGHSSLSCLHEFPIDILKIDRAFVANMKDDNEYGAITQAIVTLAHSLNISVIAEGIETEKQLIQLQTLESDIGQGYFFSKPLPADEIVHWIENRQTGLRLVG